MSKFKNSILLPVLIALLAVVIGLAVHQSQQTTREPLTDELPVKFKKAILLPAPKAIQGIDFIDHNGDRFTASELTGHWSIVFFGFTHCPDVCPTTLHTLKQVKARLTEQQRWGNYQVLMVSVDPARDTPQKLADYVPFFDTEFIGITGTLEATTAFAKQLGILFFAGDVDSNGAYDVDHGAALILLNPNVEMAGVISAPHHADDISADLIALANHYADDPITAKPAASGAMQKHPIITEPDAVSDSAELVLENAWIRPAPLGSNSLAGYFDIVNNSDRDVVINAVSSPQFDAVMIHDTVLRDGTASMQHRDELRVPANGRATLKPLATHLMLMRPEQAMTVGSEVEVNFTTTDGRGFRHLITVRPSPFEN